MGGDIPVVADVAWMLRLAWDVFGMEFTLYGFTLSFRQVFGYSFVITFVLWGFALYLDL